MIWALSPPPKGFKIDIRNTFISENTSINRITRIIREYIMIVDDHFTNLRNQCDGYQLARRVQLKLLHRFKEILARTAGHDDLPRS